MISLTADPLIAAPRSLQVIFFLQTPIDDSLVESLSILLVHSPYHYALPRTAQLSAEESRIRPRYHALDPDYPGTPVLEFFSTVLSHQHVVPRQGTAATAGPFRPCPFPLPFYLSFMRLDSSLSSLPYVFVRLLLDLMPPGGTCALSEPKCQCMDTMPHDRLECGTSRLHPLREPFYGLSPLLFRLHPGFLMLVGVLESTRVESRLRTFVHLSALPLLSRVFSPWLICFWQNPLACSSLSLSSASQLPLHVLCHPSPLWSPSYCRRTPIEPCHHTASVFELTKHWASLTDISLRYCVFGVHTSPRSTIDYSERAPPGRIPVTITYRKARHQ